MPQNEPTPIDEMLDNLVRRLHGMRRTPSPMVDVESVHALAVVLADTRRLLGRPVSWMTSWVDEDPNRTKPERPTERALDVAHRRLAAGVPVADDAMLAENLRLRDRVARLESDEKTRAAAVWSYIADALGDRAPAEPLLWPEAYEAIRKLREQADLALKAERKIEEVTARLNAAEAKLSNLTSDELEAALDEARSANAQITAIRQTLASLGIELRDGDDIEDAVADLGAECKRADDLIEHVETWVSAPRAAADQFDIALRAAYEDWCRPASKAGPSLAEQLHREHARWQRVQPVISALHGWEAVTPTPPRSGGDEPARCRATITLLDAFEQWQKDEQVALNEEDGPVDVPRQPDDPGVEETPATAALPAPTGDGEPVLPVALQLNGLTNRIKDDLRERAKAGWAKYGTVLKTNNGRSALVDAYQEALDAIMYTTQDWIEHKSTGTTQKAVALALRLAEELEVRGL